MTCSGCSGAVERVLKKREGKFGHTKKFELLNEGCANYPFFSDVKDIAIDMDKQRVYVTSDASAEDLLAVIKKTGKKTSYVGTA
jgi:copper chaperone CopZ